jgi:hypothetical protein
MQCEHAVVSGASQVPLLFLFDMAGGETWKPLLCLS